jgi:hypothetical protein
VNFGYYPLQQVPGPGIFNSPWALPTKEILPGFQIRKYRHNAQPMTLLCAAIANLDSCHPQRRMSEWDKDTEKTAPTKMNVTNIKIDEDSHDV